LAVVLGGAAVLAGALGWGRSGLAAAALGTALSLANVWVLHRLAVRAVANVALTGPAAAASQLTSALGAKTMVLLLCAWLCIRGGGVATVPFALGLLVAAFALLGGGLLGAVYGE
jgi:hypothetical protein